MKSKTLSILSGLFATILSVTVYRFMVQEETRRLENTFVREAEEIYRVLTNTLEKLPFLSAALEHYFHASEEVTWSEFEKYATPFLRDVPGIAALEWVPAVQSETRVTFETTIRKIPQVENAPSELTQFKITEVDVDGTLIPAKDRDTYYPVLFISPFKEENKKALGYDLGSESVRLNALTNALKFREPCITEQINLVQEGDLGFLLVFPVFAQAPESLDVPSKQPSGFVVIVFRSEELLHYALSAFHTRKEIDVSISDLDHSSSTIIANFPRQSPRGNHTTDELAHRRSQGDFAHKKNFEFGHRTWEIQFLSNRDYMARRSYLPLTTSISLAGFAFLLILYSRQKAAKKELTEDLNAALSDIEFLDQCLHICSFCKKIQSDKGNWEQLDRYISERSETRFNRCVCPQCAHKHYGNLLEPNETWSV